MIFNIPEWPVDNDLKHVSTDWLLSRDKDGTDVVIEVLFDSVNLLAWETNIVIPTGEIWYIKAKRNFEDVNGNTVTNTNWIGPKPVFNEESNGTDYLAPKFEIEEPYIADLVYTPGTELTLTLVPYDTNISYVKTIVRIENDLGEQLAIRFHNIDTDGLDVTFTNDDFDLELNNYIKILIVHEATHSTTSSVFEEVILLKKLYYSIDGNTKDIDPYNDNTIGVTTKLPFGLTIAEAYLYDLNGNLLKTLEIVNNRIVLPKLLSYDSSYNVSLNISYIDSDGVTKYIADSFQISTITSKEIVPINEDITYQLVISRVSSYEIGSMYDTADLTGKWNIEEPFSYVFPLKEKNADTLNNFTFNRRSNVVEKINDNSYLNNYGDMTFRMLKTDKALIQYRNTDGNLTFDFFEYDGYNDMYTLIGTVVNDWVGDNPDISKIVQLGRRVYIAGLSNLSKDTIEIQMLDIYTGEVKPVTTILLNGPVIDFSITTYKDDSIIIIPHGNGEFRSYIYDIESDTYHLSLSMPSDFTDKLCHVFKLNNGDIVGWIKESNIDPFNYFILDISKEAITNKRTLYSGNATVRNILQLRDGKLLFITEIDNVVESWMFY